MTHVLLEQLAAQRQTELAARATRHRSAARSRSAMGPRSAGGSRAPIRAASSSEEVR